MTAAIYARCSKDEQHTDNQFPELRRTAEFNGWDVVEYTEHASGKSGAPRPVLKQMMEDAKAGKFQVVLVWKIDRLARSLIDFVALVREIDALGIRFLCPSQNIDTDQRTPLSKFLMHILAVFAELERDLIIERVHAGVKEYRKASNEGRVGKSRHSKSGKDLAHGRPKKVFHRGRIAELREQGMSWRKIGKELGVPQATVRLAMKAA